MSHFAKVVNGVVVKVIAAEQTYINELPDRKTWVQTSYNTRENKHINNGSPFRGNFAGIGYTYDDVNDVFYAPKPSEGAVLNTETWSWKEAIKPATTD